MEKFFFKYKLGYINIEDTNLYLTKTGNWSEINQLKENFKVNKKSNKEKFEISKSFYFVILILSTFLLIITERKNTLVNFLVIGFNILFFYLKYFSDETVPNFKIPSNKILNYKLLGNDIEVFFRNGLNQEDRIKLENVDLKILTILDDLLKDSHN